MLNNFLDSITQFISTVLIVVASLFSGGEIATESSDVASSTEASVIEVTESEVVASSSEFDSKSEAGIVAAENIGIIFAPYSNQSDAKEVLSLLRNTSWSDVKRPVRECVEYMDEKKVSREPDVSSGIRFGIRSGDTQSTLNDILVSATDSNGGHAGFVVYKNDPSFTIEDNESKIWNATRYGSMEILSLKDYTDGMVTIKNGSKENIFVMLTISEITGACDISGDLSFGLKPNESLYVPVFATGDIGPIERDLNNDDVTDYYQSLIFEDSVEQTKLMYDWLYLENPKQIREGCKVMKEQLSGQEAKNLPQNVNTTIDWCESLLN